MVVISVDERYVGELEARCLSSVSEWSFFSFSLSLSLFSSLSSSWSVRFVGVYSYVQVWTR